MNCILQPNFKTTRRAMMRKLKMTSGRSQENSFIVITMYLESICTCRKKNHFLFHWSTSTLPERHTHPWMYYWRTILKITGIWMEIVSCQMRGQVSPPDGCTSSGGRLTRKQTTSRPDIVWPDICKHMSDASKTQRKAKAGYRKTKNR